MMTLIASVNIVMSSIHRRWLTPLETIATQGFPIDVKHSYGKPVNSFALRRLYEEQGFSLPVPKSSRRAMCHQAGNSMHTTISGMALLYVLTQVMVDPDVMQLQAFARQRMLALTAAAAKPASPKVAAVDKKRKRQVDEDM
jgi:hypothetical protein